VLAHYVAGRYAEAIAVSDEVLARLRRLAPFLTVAEFGARFVRPEHRARAQEGLRKAGF
jgi:hypothetical protein